MNANTLKSTLKILLVSCILFSSFSCNTNNYKESVMAETVEMTDDFDAVEEKSSEFKADFEYTNSIPTDLKIIKSANVRYKVKSVKEATKRIKNIAQRNGAYVSDLRFQNNLYKIENRFTIKVPQKYFDKVMDSVNTVVEFVEYENITTKDVTEEYVDLETRLKTKLEVKGRCETILRKNAKTVEEILQTEEKLRVIQEEIEAAQGRLKYLTNKVAFSTIQIDLYETVDYKPEPESYTKTFWSKTLEGLANGWCIVEVIIIGVINIWPLLLIFTGVFFFIRKRLKK